MISVVPKTKIGMDAARSTKDDEAHTLTVERCLSPKAKAEGFQLGRMAGT
jgi:hypothetical protein